MAESTVQPTSIPPNAKRKRTELDDQRDTQEEPAKSSAYWFEDGNLILQAQNTQFRVHRGVIARHSQVFRDMFSLPQPATETLFDGCPLVHVSDAPQDWENIFSILYDNEASYKSTDEFAFPLLASMLRLGKKYQIDGLQESAFERIRVELPDSLDDWDKKFEDGNGLIIDSDREIDLVNLLLELGFQSFLPVAYSLCIKSLGPASILCGLERDDGITSRLSTESIEKLMLAREKMSQAIVDHEFKWVKMPSLIPAPKCRTRTECESHLSKVLPNFIPGPRASRALNDFDFDTWDMYCSHCFAAIQDIYPAGRKHIWNNLPSYFELPKWQELKDI